MVITKENGFKWNLQNSHSMFWVLVTDIVCGEAIPIFYSGPNLVGGTIKTAKPWTEQIGENYPLEFLEMFKNATHDKNNIDTNTICKLAEMDFVPAIYLLGEMYLYGISPVEMNFAQARMEYVRAAEQKFPPAYAALAFMSHYGLGLDDDFDEDDFAIYLDLGVKAGSLEAKLMKAYNMASESPEIAADYSFITSFINELFDEIPYETPAKPILTNTLELRTNNIEENLELKKYEAMKGDEISQRELGLIYGMGLASQEINKNLSAFYSKNSNSIVGNISKANLLIEEGRLEEAREILYKLFESDLNHAHERDKEYFWSTLIDFEDKAGNKELNIMYNEIGHSLEIEKAIFNRIMSTFKLADILDDPIIYININHMINSISYHSYLNWIYFFKKYSSNYHFRDEKEILQNTKYSLEIFPWKGFADIGKEWYRNNNIEKAVLLWLRAASTGYHPAGRAAARYLLYGNTEIFNKTKKGALHKADKIFRNILHYTESFYLNELIGDKERAFDALTKISEADKLKNFAMAKGSMFNGVNPDSDMAMESWLEVLDGDSVIHRVAAVNLLPRLLIGECLNPKRIPAHILMMVTKFKSKSRKQGLKEELIAGGGWFGGFSSHHGNGGAGGGSSFVLTLDSSIPNEEFLIFDKQCKELIRAKYQFVEYRPAYFEDVKIKSGKWEGNGRVEIIVLNINEEDSNRNNFEFPKKVMILIGLLMV